LAGKFKSQIKSATTGVYDSNKTLLQWDNTLLKDVNSCWNTKITFNLETSDG